MKIRKEYIDKDMEEVLQQVYDMASKGLDILITIKPFKNQRSTYQNNYYWFICNHLAGWLNFHEIVCTLDENEMGWDQNLIHTLNKYKLGLNSTKSLSVKEFIDYMEKVNILWSKKTDGNYVVPEPVGSYLKRYGIIKD